MRKKLKDFEGYSVVERFGNGFTRWEHDGSMACVDDDYCTRALVRAAFEALANSPDMWGSYFTRQDAARLGFKLPRIAADTKWEF